MIVVVGLSHKTAPIEVRERLAIPADRVEQVLALLRQQSAIGEVMLLSTCNRVEVYAASATDDEPSGAATIAAVEKVLCSMCRPGGCPNRPPCLYRYAGAEAVRHLFRVSSSLDSLVVGEAQVLGQVKDAFEVATRAGTLATQLGRVAECAFHVAKRVRSETQIGAGTVSVSSVAVELARQIFGNLQKRPVALLGAGKMGVAAARYLCAAGSTLFVVNRSVERAAEVASRFDGHARGWDQLVPTLIEADVVIASTASQTFVLTRELVSSIRKQRRGRSLFIIDIAVPRNVDPRVNDVDGVYLYDIDDLSKIANETLHERAQEAPLAATIVEEEVRCFETWLGSLQVTPAIVALRNQVREVLMCELDRSLHGKLKHLGESERKALDGMISAAVKKLTHTPTVRLKEAVGQGDAGELVHSLKLLFDLDQDPAKRLARSVPPRQLGTNGSSQPAPCERASDPPDDDATERASDPPVSSLPHHSSTENRP